MHRTAPDESKPTERNSFPPGLHNAFLFAIFNALSFQIVLGSPMVLYARSLEASATVLGIITGMMPLLVIFQIPAANYIDRVGYKRFVYAGWGTRVSVIFIMALVPITAGFLNSKSQPQPAWTICCERSSFNHRNASGSAFGPGAEQAGLGRPNCH